MPIQLSGSLVITGSITTTGGITISGSILSASYSDTASFSNNFRVLGNLTASTALVTGTLTAQTLVVQTVTSSIVYSSGSNLFGSQLSNTQTFTGSIQASGSSSHFLMGGSVGIGVTNPSSKLHVVGTSLTDTFRVTDAANYTIGIGYEGTGNIGMIATFGSTAKLALGTNSIARLIIDGTGSAAFSSSVTAASMFINTTDNNLGSKLQISGSINIKGTSGYNGWTISQSGGDANAAFNLSYAAGGATNVITAEYNTGNVGIGTSSPTAKLDVNGEIRMTGSTLFRGMSSSTLQLCGGLSSSNVKINGSTEIITMDTNGSERLRVTSNGYTKMSSASAYAEIGGLYHECYGGAANGYTLIVTSPVATPLSQYVFDIRFSAASPNNGSARFFSCSDSTAVRAFMKSNGGLSNYQANNTDLSDIRTKKDIISLESYWNKFKALEIVKYKYKDQTHEDYNIGVIAQQVEAVAPEFVDVDGWSKNDIESESPLKSIYTKDLYHATIKVLQEAMAKIETLEAKVTALETK